VNLSVYSERRDSPLPSISVVVPIYNERDNIEPLYDALSPVLRGLRQHYEIIFVDDGSRDGSWERLSDLGRRDPCVKVIQLRRNFGQTAAMHAGIQHSVGEYVVTMDGDMQNDPADIPMMLAKLDEGYDLVHGWRQRRKDAWLNRKLPSKAANWLIAKVTGFPAHDLGCSLKAMRGEIARELPLYGEMHRFIPILAHARGARCVEVVTRHHPRRSGVTKYGIGRSSRVLLDLATVKLLTGFFASPMKLFGGLGLWCGLLALVAAAGAAVSWLCQASSLLTGVLLAGAGLAAVTGVQLAMLGLLAELSVRTAFYGQGGRPYHVRRRVNFDDASPGSGEQALRNRAA
jgi:glycosyltransferase involved in cell wall biosynthesis